MEKRIFVVLILLVTLICNSAMAEDQILRRGVEVRAKEAMLIDNFGKDPDSIDKLSAKSTELKDMFAFTGNWDENFYNAWKVKDSTETCAARQMASSHVTPAYLWHTLDSNDPTIIKATAYLNLCYTAFPGELSATEIATAPSEEIASHIFAIQKRNGVSLSRAIIQIWLQEVASECSPADWRDGLVKFATDKRLREIANNRK